MEENCLSPHSLAPKLGHLKDNVSAALKFLLEIISEGLLSVNMKMIKILRSDLTE